MTKTEALERFLGKNGHKRVNCAVAIAQTFRECLPIDDEVIKSFHKLGGGRAPGKVCGAYYAAHYLFEKHNPEQLKKIENYFKNESGSVECKVIRKLKKLDCNGCVLSVAEYIENHCYTQIN